MNKYLPWLCVVGVSLLAAYLFLQLLDAGISIDGARSNVKAQESRARVAMVFVQSKWIGSSREDLWREAERLRAGGEIVKDHGKVIEVGEMTFSVSEGRVVAIEYFN